MSSQNVTRKLPAIPLPAAPFSTTPDGWTRTAFTEAGMYEFVPKQETSFLYIVAIGGGGGGYAENDDNLDGGNGGETSVVSANHGLELVRVLGGAGATKLARGLSNKLTQEARSNWLSNLVQPSIGHGTNGSTVNQNAAAGGNSHGAGAASFTLPSKGQTGTDNNSPIANFNLSRSWPGYAGSTPRQATKKMLAGSRISFNYTVTNVNTTVYFQFLVNGVLHHKRENVSSYTGSFSYTIPADGDYTFTWELYQRYQLAVSGTATLSVSSVTVTGNNNIIYYPQTRGGAGGDYAHGAFLPESLTVNVGAGGLGSGANFYTPPEAVGNNYGGGGTAGASGANGAVFIFEYSGTIPEEPLDTFALDHFNIANEPIGVLRTSYFGGAVGTVKTVRHYLRPSTKTVIALLVGGGGGHNTNYSNVTNQAPSAKLIAENFQIVAGGGSSNRAYSYTYWDSKCSYNSQTQTWSGCNRTGYTYYNGLGGQVDSDLPTLVKRENVHNNGAPLPNIGLVNSYGQGAARQNTAWHHGGDGAYALVSFGGYEDQQYFDLEIPGGGVGANGNGYPGAIYIFEAESWTGFNTQSVLDILQNSPLGDNNVTQTAMLLLEDRGDAPNNVTQNAFLVLEDRGEAPNNVTQNSLLVTKKLGNKSTYISESRLDVAYADSISNIRTSIAAEELLIEADVPKIRASANIESILHEADTPKIFTSAAIESALLESAISRVSVGSSLQEILLQSDAARMRASASIASVLTEDFDPTVMPSQNTKLVLLRLNKTIIYLMDFGVVRYPEKGKLYDSQICTVEGVEDTITLQLEGHLPEGSTIFLNGEDVGRSVVARNGDNIQLRSGTTNWYDSRITLYGYVTRDDQVIREYAGFWTMLQADLSAAKHAWLGILSLYTGVLKAVTRPFGVQYKISKSIASVKGVQQIPSVSRANTLPVQLTPDLQIANLAGVETVPEKIAHNTVEFSPTIELADYKTAAYDYSAEAYKQTVLDFPVSQGTIQALSAIADVALSPKTSLKHTVKFAASSDATKANNEYVNTAGIKSSALSGTVAGIFRERELAKIPVTFLLFGLQTKAAFAKKNFLGYKEKPQNIFGIPHRYTINPKHGESHQDFAGFSKGMVSDTYLRMFDFYKAEGNFTPFKGIYVNAYGGAEHTNQYAEPLGNAGILNAPGVEKQTYAPVLIQLYPDFRQYAEIRIQLEPVLRTQPRAEFFLDDFIRTETNAGTFTLDDFEFAKALVVKANKQVTSFSPSNYQGMEWTFAYRPDKEPLPVERGYKQSGTQSSAGGEFGYTLGSGYLAETVGYAWVFYEARNIGTNISEYERSGVTVVNISARFDKSSVKSTYFRYSATWQFFNRTLVPYGYALAAANIGKFRVTPVLRQPGKNRISSAKYYMGFSTKAEVEEFTKNFFMPKLQNKLDGYIYRVGTTDTLVCEVRGANMPIAWLMHGG